MHSDHYKKLQENRFSNNVGTTYLEIILLSQLPFILMFFSHVISSIIWKSTSLINLVLDFVLIFIPLILLLTVLSEYLFKFYFVFCIVSCVILLLLVATKNTENLRTALKRITVKDSRLPCVSSFRSIVNLFSVVCILAADFECFPKKYLKTDVYGYGLMDTGVGLYVISNALTNTHFIKQAREKPVKIIVFMLSTFKKVIPLLTIGIGRYIATAAVQYHHNVSEYGVHWNFFISLSILAIFNEFLVLFVNRISTVCLLTITLLSFQEYILYAGVRSWINDDSTRVGFLASNKEGICSLLGYEVIYLSGLIIKHFLPRKGDNFKKYSVTMKNFVSAFFLFTILTIASENSFGVSRKLSNCGYIFLIISVSLISLMNVILQEFFVLIVNASMLKNRKPVTIFPSIIEAINYNGLAFFLAGNLMTGVINILLPTLTLNSVFSCLILTVYSFICCFFAVYLYQKKIRLR